MTDGGNRLAPERSGSEEAKRQALRRTRRAATAALVACAALFLSARALQPQFPWLGFVAAFFEAATIGGIADWYAVVALFRRPLGLPIPHTAIIPANQGRIADNLGRFIEANFLAPEAVKAKLREVDFAALVAEWLSGPERARGLSDFVARLVPQALAAIDGSGLREFAGRRLADQLERIEMAPLAANLLAAFTAGGRHQKLFDQLVLALGKVLSDAETLASMRDRIREEMPTLFNLFKADAYLLRRIVASAEALLEEARRDRDHPLRQEFDRFLQNFIDELRTSKDYARRSERMKRELLRRPELRGLADDMWQGFRTFIEADARAPRSAVRAHLAAMFVDIGRHLATDPAIRSDMNAGFVVALGSFVESQKSGVSGFIADQVKRWDLAQLTRVIETNVGRDLQYIRFNGMVVGGLAGLLLYSAELLFLPN